MMAVSQYTTGKAVMCLAGSPTTFRTNRRNVAWTQDLPKEVILLSSFTLTRDKYLGPETATYLRDVYSRIDAEKNSTEHPR